jgi:phage protein U
MLAQLGAVQFEVAPMNMHETDHDGGADYVAHAVVGSMPPLEFVGEASETWSVRGRLFPEKFGGLGSIASLHAMRRSGQAQFFMRGDGTPMGWVVIERVNEKSTYLGRDGVGRVIEFEVSLKRSNGPNAAGMFNALQGIFS